MKKKLSFCIWAVIVACSNPSQESQPPIAQVYDAYLMPADVKNMVGADATPQDSARIVSNYVESWAKMQLLYHEAVTNAELDLNEIERRVLEYKYQLITHAFLQQYINKNLDTVVTEQQIRDYYEANKSNFELKENIVKGLLLKISDVTPDKAKAYQWLRSQNRSDWEQLRSYAFSYTQNPIISDTTWMPLSALIRNTPLREEIRNEVQFLATRNYASATDGEYLYLLKIFDYKIADQPSPLEFVKETIRDVILNQRKMALQHQLEVSLLEKARRSHNYRIANR
ncbi:MAG: peptidylprolyl isomerase [Cytophagales bacterium]|nr:peptidylprolyl isomerase [Bernardetiaceae bacterium]MDW8203672.1 peptidylprolyl isomerase [Cytophagales bacterium]